jgi:hypothetical protein
MNRPIFTVPGRCARSQTVFVITIAPLDTLVGETVTVIVTCRLVPVFRTPTVNARSVLATTVFRCRDDNAPRPFGELVTRAIASDAR